MRALAFVPLIVVLLAAPSWAALGESVDSVAADQQRLRGELSSTVGDGFSIHEIRATDGTVVREYSSPEGQVFAVSWRGPVVPDLAHLLGAHFAEFQRAVQSRVRRHGPLVVRTGQLVVEMGGHMRAFRGRAYLPQAVPAAVSAAVVR